MNIIRPCAAVLLVQSIMLLIRGGASARAEPAAPATAPSVVTVSLVGPMDLATADSPTPKLTWEIAGDGRSIDYFVVELAPPEQPDFPFTYPSDQKYFPKLPSATRDFVVPFPLRADTTYKWQVIAYLKDGSQAKPKAEFSFTTPTVFAPLHKLGFTLQKSYPGLDFFSGPGGSAGSAQGSGGGSSGGGQGSGSGGSSSGKGQNAAAAFSFLHASSGDTYAIDGALFWSGPQISAGIGTPTASFEAHVSDDPKATEDALILRSGIHNVYYLGAPKDDEIKVEGIWADYNVKYATDREFNIQQLSLEPLISVNVPKLAIGSIQPLLGGWPMVTDQTGQLLEDIRLDTRHGVWLAWRPYLGIDAGHTLDDRAKTETPQDFFRVLGIVKGQLLFYDVARLLSLQSVDVYAEDDAFYSTARESGDHFHDFLQTGIEFYVTKNVNLTLQYKEGKASPTFKGTHSIGVSVGVQF